MWKRWSAWTRTFKTKLTRSFEVYHDVAWDQINLRSSMYHTDFQLELRSELRACGEKTWFVSLKSFYFFIYYLYRLFSEISYSLRSPDISLYPCYLHLSVSLLLSVYLSFISLLFYNFPFLYISFSVSLFLFSFVSLYLHYCSFFFQRFQLFSIASHLSTKSYYALPSEVRFESLPRLLLEKNSHPLERVKCLQKKDWWEGKIFEEKGENFGWMK